MAKSFSNIVRRYTATNLAPTYVRRYTATKYYGHDVNDLKKYVGILSSSTSVPKMVYSDLGVSSPNNLAVRKFWLDIWKGEITLRDKFPRIFALEMDKTITVAAKMASLVDSSFRRPVRGGIEHVQYRGDNNMAALGVAAVIKEYAHESLTFWNAVACENLLWTRVIKAIHGEDGKNGSGFKVGYKSIWRSILQEVETLKIKGIHLNNFMQKKLGNGADTYFWEDLWHGDMVLKQRYPRLYALEVKKTVDVASKLSQENLTWSFRRAPRSGVEQDQLTDLTTYVEGVVLGVTPDRWYWTLDGSGEFSVASARKVIDDNRFPEVSTQTRWIKAVPIKVNIHAWKVRMDCLPTRLNISRRGIDIPSILCPVCGSVTESSSHLFFDCLVAKDNFRKICRW
ncbi:RNA-directed DNA polymerase, eukaryota, reverse transcriptase zinc-binding domain protein [Tanacetum coccineum]